MQMLFNNSGKICLILLSLFFSHHIFAQKDFEQFRSIEKRIRYKYTDSLLIYSKSNTGIFEDSIFRIWAKGKYLYQNSEFDNSYTELKRAKSLSINQQKMITAAEISLDISSNLAILENTGKSLDELFFAKRIFDVNGTSSQKARLHIAFGELYRKIGQYEKATDHLLESKKYLDNKTELLASYYNRRSAIFSETGKWDSSYYYSKRALAFAQKSNDPSLEGISENEIGYILKHRNKKDSAILHFKKADSIFRECGMTAYALQSTAHYAVLVCELNSNDVKKVVGLLRRGHEIASKNKWYRLRRDYAEYLRNAYGILHLKDSFYFYEIEFREASISLLSNQHEMNSALVESLFQEEKYEEKIEANEKLLREEKAQREKAEAEKKFLRWFFILGSLVLLLLVFILIFQINRRRKIQADKIEKEKKNQELLQLLKNNEALVQEMSHRVKNNLSVLSGLLGIQKSRASNTELKKELGDTLLRVESIAAIHNQFYDNKESANINLQRAFNELIHNVSLAMGHESNFVKTNKIEEVSIDIARAVNLSMILNELVTNSFKYAIRDKSDFIEVQLIHSNNKIILSVIDSGNGFDPTELKNRKDKTESMGFYLIDILCRQLYAEKEIINENGSFRFSIIFNQ